MTTGRDQKALGHQVINQTATISVSLKNSKNRSVDKRSKRGRLNRRWLANSENQRKKKSYSSNKLSTTPKSR